MLYNPVFILFYFKIEIVHKVQRKRAKVR